MRLSSTLSKLTAYEAGTPMSQIMAELGLEHMVKLASNELPDGPFPEVVAAIMSNLASLNRYPDGGALELRSALASGTGLDLRQIVVGNGSCELLMLLGQALLGPGTHMVFPDPSFVVYRTIAVVRESEFDAVPLREDGSHDLETMLEAVGPDTRLVIVCNPNNPTGNYLPPEEVHAFLQQVPEDTVVALDEAYVEFVTHPGREDAVSWLSRYPNLVVLRTFSKVYGLAGMRVGYGLGHPALIEALDKLRQPFNVNSLAQVAAAEAYRHPRRVAQRREMVARERARLAAGFDRIGLTHLPSESNFILLHIEGLPTPGEEVPRALLERGVMTRSGYFIGCPGWIRVTVGSDEENDLLLSALSDIAAGGAGK
jgi:histidinol-phosphate aminotransferase